MRIIMTLIFATLFTFGFLALAQQVDPNQDFINLLAGNIGQFKGMTTLAIVGLVVQLLLKFLDTSWFGSIFSKLDGSIKLLIVHGLGIAGSVAALMAPPNSMSLLSALTSGAVLSVLMVYGNELYTHFLKKDPAAK